MTWLEALDALAALATIVTAIVAVLAYGSYRRAIRLRVKKLENLLIAKSQPGDDFLTVEKLAAAMGCTIEQVIETASGSNNVEPYAGPYGSQHCYRYKR